MFYYTKGTDIVGYTFDTENYCPDHIVDALPTGAGQAFDGWRACVPMSPEDNLTEIAYAFGIDRQDESSYDSREFPKVIFQSSVTEDDYCGTCGRQL